MDGVNFSYRYNYPVRQKDSFERDKTSPPSFSGDVKTNSDKDLDRVKTEVSGVKDTFKTFTNSVDSFNRAAKQNKSKNDEYETVMSGAVSAIPGLRRVSSIDNNAKDHNKIKMIGLAGIALINAKEDLRDLHSVLGRVKVNVGDGYCGKFGFFTGTILEKWLGKSEAGYNFIKNVDKTLGDLKIIRKLLLKFGIKRASKIGTKEINHFQFRKVKSFILDKSKHPRFRAIIDIIKSKKSEESKTMKSLRYIQKQCTDNLCKPEIVTRKFVKYEGSRVGRLIGYTLDRMPLLSLGFATLLEIPTIYDAVKNRNDKKQIVKSGISVGMSITTGALLSAAGAMAGNIPVIGPALSVVGLGLGCFIGDKAATEINKHV